MAVMYVANHLNVRAIIALTESGSTHAVDVARALRHPGVRVHAARGYAPAREHVPRRLRGAVRRDGHRSVHPRQGVRDAAATTARPRAPAISCCSRKAISKAWRGGPTRCRSSPCPPRARAPAARECADQTRKALVLPGAGARGAYQVGVLKAVASAAAEGRAESLRDHLGHLGRRDQRGGARGPCRQTSSARSATWSASGRTSRAARSTARTTGRC